MEFGSLVNMVTAGAKQGTEPVVGMAATICYWSDRHPATIVEVLKFKTGARAGQIKGVVIQQDTYTRVSGSAQDGSAQYEYERNCAAPRETFLIDKYGRYGSKSGGGKLSIGRRERYYDPHF